MKNSWIEFKYKLPYEGVHGGNIGGDAPFDYLIIIAIKIDICYPINLLTKYISQERFIRSTKNENIFYVLIPASQATKIYQEDETCRPYMVAWISFDGY